MRTVDRQGSRLYARLAARVASAHPAALALALATAWIMPASAVAKTALLVVGSTTLSASDTALKQRLETYYPTTIRDDGATADLTKDVIVVSSSVVASTLGTKYKATSKGVVVLAPAVLPAMAMTAAGAFGTLTGQTQVKIIAGGSTLAGGFASGSLATIYRSGQAVGWAIPAATALKVAVVAAGTSTQVTIFRHLKGATMVGGYVAPGRRIGYYLQAANVLTNDGWRLFDAAVAQAANLTAVPPPIEPPSSDIKSFVAFGDSYTASFRSGVPSWADQIDASGDARIVVNLAVSGATAEGNDLAGTLDGQVDRWIASYRSQGVPDRTVIYIGYNDVKTTKALNAAMDQFRAQVDRLIANGVTQNQQQLVLCLLHDWSRNPGTTTSVRARVTAWNQYVASVAAARPNVVIVDLFTLFEDVFASPSTYDLTNVTTPSTTLSATTYLYFDGSHFGSKGQAIIAGEVRPRLQ
jgi:lysophospholipase L1-like esterase